MALSKAQLLATRQRVGVIASYIDPDQAGTGHAGSYADPYSTVDALTWLALQSGDLRRRRIRLKAATTFVGRIVIAASNYHIEPYGDGAKPIISNHVDVSALTWVADDGALGGPTADTYFLPVSGGADNWTAGNTAITFHDDTDHVQCEARTSYADLIGTEYQCAETRYSTWPFLQFWDTASTPDRMWIKVPAGFNPNTHAALRVLRPVAGEGPMTLTAVANVTVNDIVLQCGAIYNFNAAVAAAGGLTLNRVESRNGGVNCFAINGTSKDVRGPDVYMNSCKAYRTTQGSVQGHGVEMGWMDNIYIDDFDVRNVGVFAVKLNLSSSHVHIRRLMCRQTGYGLVHFSNGSAETGGSTQTLHDDVEILNCDTVQRTNYQQHATSGVNPAGGGGVFVSQLATNRKITSNVRIYNNSFDLDANAAIYGYINADVGLGDNTVRFKNNLVRLSQLTHSTNLAVFAPNHADTAPDWVMDDNIYQFGVTATNQLYVLGTPYSSQANWRTAWNSIGDGTNEDASLIIAAGAALFTNPAATVQAADLSLVSGVTAANGLADSADPYTPTTDILGVARGADPDAGAYEYV